VNPCSYPYGRSIYHRITFFYLFRIPELINHYRPGTTEFWLYAETDHALVKVGSLMDGWKIRSEGKYTQAMQERYNEQVIKDVIEWMM
jgi:ABC-type arginine transport system permease subunit